MWAEAGKEAGSPGIVPWKEDGAAAWSPGQGGPLLPQEPERVVLEGRFLKQGRAERPPTQKEAQGKTWRSDTGMFIAGQCGWNTSMWSQGESWPYLVAWGRPGLRTWFPHAGHRVLGGVVRREGQDGLPPSCLPHRLCPLPSLLLHLFSHRPPSPLPLPLLAPAVLCSSQFYPGLGVVQGHRLTFGGNSSLGTGRANLSLWPQALHSCSYRY